VTIVSIQIQVSDVWTASINKPREKLPLSRFDMTNIIYIKGKLSISISEKNMPCLGYFDESDVDIFEWIEVLRNVRKDLEECQVGTYKYQIPEQGGEVVEFKRIRETLYISILESEITGVKGNDYWQTESCLFEDFVSELDAVIESFYTLLVREIPEYVEQVWKAYYIR
jgi:hypothetical protein